MAYPPARSPAAVHAGTALRAVHGQCARQPRWRSATMVLALLAWVVGATLVVAARADQADARLDALFEELAATADPERASSVERDIWRIWSLSGDDRVDSYMTAATETMLSGRLDRAIALFGEVIELRPDFAEAWNKRATALFHADRHDESMRDIQRTLALEPRHFGAISGMGLIFLARGDLPGALMAFEQVLKIHPHALHAQVQVQRIRDRLSRNQA